jgi:hypothetical protein
MTDNDSVVIDISFESPLNTDQIAMLQAVTGLRCRNVHDDNLKTRGSGVVHLGESEVLLLLTRNREEWRLVGVCHQATANDDKPEFERYECTVHELLQTPGFSN